jgi:hypothetical protein
VDENHLIFQSVPVKIVSELAEQIGLDHVARYSKTGTTTQSTASKQMGAQFGAINTFIQGLAIAHDYVKVLYFKLSFQQKVAVQLKLNNSHISRQSEMVSWSKRRQSCVKSTNSV